MFPEFQKKCQPYSCKPNYKAIINERNLLRDDNSCTGFQPTRHNPGDLKFYMYDYTVQTEYDKPLNHPGVGWYRYESTGKYP